MSDPDSTAAAAPRRNFYGRVHGKTLRASQKSYLAEDLGRFTLSGVTVEDNPARSPLDLAGLFGDCPLWLEVGFGGGEHLVHMATLNPEVALIGCEPFVNGIAMLLGKLRGAECQNVRLHGLKNILAKVTSSVFTLSGQAYTTETTM